MVGKLHSLPSHTFTHSRILIRIVWRVELFTRHTIGVRVYSVVNYLSIFLAITRFTKRLNVFNGITSTMSNRYNMIYSQLCFITATHAAIVELILKFFKFFGCVLSIISFSHCSSAVRTSGRPRPELFSKGWIAGNPTSVSYTH